MFYNKFIINIFYEFYGGRVNSFVCLTIRFAMCMLERLSYFWDIHRAMSADTNEIEINLLKYCNKFNLFENNNSVEEINATRPPIL